MPQLYNKSNRNKVPHNAVYIGRPSKWGNPYCHTASCMKVIKVATREEAVAKYEEHIRTNPKLMDAAKTELRGKDLVCWCHPLPCHGNILLKIANED